MVCGLCRNAAVSISSCGCVTTAHAATRTITGGEVEDDVHNNVAVARPTAVTEGSVSNNELVVHGLMSHFVAGCGCICRWAWVRVGVWAGVIVG